MFLRRMKDSNLIGLQNNMISKTITTLWQGKVGVHGKYRDMALKAKTGLHLNYNDEMMDVPYEKLKSGYESVQTFPDKFKRGEYKLFYFLWKPNVIIKDGIAKIINQQLEL